MSEERLPIRRIDIDEPLPGLEEAFERDREAYVLAAAELILGKAGRMVSASKHDYCRQHPDHVPLFNANVCTEPPQKIWFGDLDLTLDESKLGDLARQLGRKIYVLRERDGRFQGRDDAPLIDRAVFSVGPDGLSALGVGVRRGRDGLLHPTR